MKTTIEPKGLEVKVGRTELTAKHRDGRLTFIHPCYGPDAFCSVRDQISQDGLVMPTASETASLVYAASQNPDERYSKEILSILRDRWLWGNTGVLWTPKKEVYIQNDPKVGNGGILMDKKDLEKKLSNKDQNVRFVEYGFKLGEQTSSELGRNPFILALVGEEGAEKLAKVAERYRLNPYVYGLDKSNQDETRVSALSSGYDGGGLGVFGSCLGNGRDGWAFGVRKSSEASARKN